MGTLALTRKPGQKIILRYGDLEIEITLIFAHSTSARLAITAPKEVEIWREEVLKREQEKKQTPGTN